MDPKVAQDFEDDFEEIFEKWEAGTLGEEPAWCSTVIYPPNGRNTKTNRSLLETLMNCLLIGKFKCQYTPRIQLGWTGQAYMIGLVMPTNRHVVSHVAPPAECSEQSATAHGVAP